jgi:hypothetical protein
MIPLQARGVILGLFNGFSKFEIGLSETNQIHRSANLISVISET